MHHRLENLKLTIAVLVSIALLPIGLCSFARAEDGQMVNGVDISAPVEIVMYTIGDALTDQEMVMASVNEKLKADLNTTLKVQNIPWADWDQKYNLVLASGEYFDTIYTGNWTYYFENATKNAFRELQMEDVQKYMPDYAAQLDSSMWAQVQVGGKAYMLPALTRNILPHRVVLLRGDLREKYELPPVETLDDFQNYLITVAQNEPDIIPYNRNLDVISKLVNDLSYKEPNNLHILINSLPLFATSLENQDGEVIFMLDDPAYLEALNRAKTMYDAGVFPKNAELQKEDMAISTGLSAAYVYHVSATSGEYANVMSETPEYKPEQIDIMADKIHEEDAASVHGMALSPNTRNYERTLLMLNRFSTDVEYSDLFVFGIEGVHWEPVGDTKYTALPESANYGMNAFNCWGFYCPKSNRAPDTIPDEVSGPVLMNRWVEEGLISNNPVVGFTFDDSAVKNEMAACGDICQTTGNLMLVGKSKDVDADVAKYKQLLEQAGIGRIQDELSRQLAEYVSGAK